MTERRNNQKEQPEVPKLVTSTNTGPMPLCNDSEDKSEQHHIRCLECDASRGKTQHAHNAKAAQKKSEENANFLETTA